MTTTLVAMAVAMQMKIDVKGKGEPLLFVGGGLTGWQSWISFQERLAPSRTVGRAQPLAVQLGLEDRPLPAGYSVDFEADALAAGLDAIGWKGPVDLVAWSYGAFITLDFALDHPERVRTLTLIEPPALWVLEATGRMDEQARRESEELHVLYRRIAAGPVSEGDLASFVRMAGLVPPGKAPEQLPQWPAWVEHRRSLRTGEAPWTHRDDASRLRAFRKPVLLVKGTGSSHFLHRIIDALGSALPAATTIELPGGHAPQMVAMDAFLERLAAFQAR